MKRILLIAAAAMLMLSSCGKDEGRVIPRKKLAKIYAEMLVTDQWISSNGMRTAADTSLVYEPVFEKYGYTSDDYRKSVDEYMDDPERYSRILRTTVDILDEKLEDLKKEQARQEALAKITRIKTDFKVEDFVPYWGDRQYVRYYDSIAVAVDTAKRMYKLVPVSKRDTLYDGVRIVVQEKVDTSAVDSLGLAPVEADSLKFVKPAADEGIVPLKKVIEKR